MSKCNLRPQVDQQISANRNARHQLALDLANKDSAMQIDHSARNMHNNSRSEESWYSK